MSEENRKVAPFVESVAESTAACLVTMVQGNILALTVSHLVIASQTGIIAGAITAAAIVFARARNRWVVSAVLGVITAIVDYFVHPGMIGPVALEAVLTGIAAAVLSFLVGTLMRAWRGKAAAQD